MGYGLFLIFAVLTALLSIGLELATRLKNMWEVTHPQRSQLVWRVSVTLAWIIVLAMGILTVWRVGWLACILPMLAMVILASILAITTAIQK